ncbi:MAG: hypothetical protein JXR36_00035 [Bacteroidales bacterium]|nr:hypothetical protein [Bacteroidales bacterium]
MNPDLLNHQDSKTIKTMNTIDELITNMTDAPEKYHHLKIFLHRENTKIPSEFGRKYLFVSPDSFGLLKLNDLMVENNSIKLHMEDAFTGQLGSFTIDTNDDSFNFLLIAWEDIQTLVVQDKIRNTTKNVID